MKIKQAISVALIYLVLLSSVEFFSQVDFITEAQPKPVAAQIIEHSHDVSQEFRENLKISFSEETKSDSEHSFHKSVTSAFDVIPNLQYNSYWRECLSKNPPKKLFIDFGALII